MFDSLDKVEGDITESIGRDAEEEFEKESLIKEEIAFVTLGPLSCA